MEYRKSVIGIKILVILIVCGCIVHVTDGESTISVAKNCTVDIALVIDRSGSIHDANIKGVTDYWQDILDFASSVGDVLPVSLSQTGTRLAAVTFGHTGHLEFDLDDYGNSSDIRKALNRIDNTGREHTNTSGGFHVARTQVFTPNGGDRAGVQDIIILLTDGKPTLNVDSLPHEVEMLKNDGVLIYGVGVTHQIDEESLKAIVSTPVEEHFILVANFTSLLTIVNHVVSSFCKVEEVIVPGNGTGVPVDSSDDPDDDITLYIIIGAVAGGLLLLLALLAILLCCCCCEDEKPDEEKVVGVSGPPPNESIHNSTLGSPAYDTSLSANGYADQPANGHAVLPPPGAPPPPIPPRKPSGFKAAVNYVRTGLTRAYRPKGGRSAIPSAFMDQPGYQPDCPPPPIVITGKESIFKRLGKSKRKSQDESIYSKSISPNAGEGMQENAPEQSQKKVLSRWKFGTKRSKPIFPTHDMHANKMPRGFAPASRMAPR